MHYLLTILLLLSVTPVQASGGLAVRLIYVSNPTDAHTPASRSEARTAALAALDWWYDLAPSPIAYEVTEERSITVDEPFSVSDWLRPYVTFESEILEIYIVANQHSRRLLYGQYEGYAAPNYRAVIAVSDSISGLAPTLAHELGHTLYGLPDWGQCRSADIMCYPSQPFAGRTIGCLSLAYLGNPCHRSYLPQVTV